MTTEAIAPFEQTNEYGAVALRNCVALAFFFDQAPEEVAPQIGNALEIYLAAIPPNKLKYAVIGASSGQYRAFSKSTVTTCKKQLAVAGVKKRDLTSIHLNSHADQAPEYEFSFLGQRPNEDFPEADSALNIVFPIDSVSPSHIQRFVSTITTLSESVDYLCGYCSPAVVRMEEALGSVEHHELRRLATRHPGYDIPSSNESSANLLGGRVRGAHWITWLGPRLQEQLGGEGTLRQKLHAPITVEPLNKGVMIRAGEFPELGDADRQQDVRLLRHVAKVLEPITLFGDYFATIFQVYRDEALREQWERRFLDSASPRI